jgi:hypothetical protein
VTASRFNKSCVAGRKWDGTIPALAVQGRNTRNAAALTPEIL